MIPHLTVVDTGEPFVYPVAKSERLDGQTFVKWHHHRWLASEMHLMATFEVKGMCRDLVDLAQTQSPMGTLPLSRAIIARLLRADERHFEALCGMTYGPLAGWLHCVTEEGEPRFYHPVVLEQVQDALARRAVWLAKRSAAAVREARRRLVQALMVMGADKAVIADEALIARMDDWLNEHWRAKRGAEAYQRVMAHAGANKWFGKTTIIENKG